MDKKTNEVLIGQHVLAQILARVFLADPDEKVITSLAEEGLLQSLPYASTQKSCQEGLDLLRQWHSQDANSSFADIKSDHMRLFIGPKTPLAPPWESTYFSRAGSVLVFQQETLEVRTWYKRFGLQVKELHHEPDDNISLEIEFISYLSKQAADLADSGDEEQFSTHVEAIKQFSQEHLLKWAYLWCDKVDENARSDYYKGVAKITRGFLKELEVFISEN